MSVRVEHGDCLDVMRRLLAEGVRVDAVVCDPPYHLSSIVKRFSKTGAADRQASRVGAYARHARGFMGKVWDGGTVSFEPRTWALCFELLKPGGHLIAFGGPRTYHRMAVAVEDAGFEIRDQIQWLFGSGFPKSHDVSKGIDKAAGVEREDKFEGSFVRRAGPTGNKRCSGCGKWLVSGNPCQCPRPQDAPVTEAAQPWAGWGTALKPAAEPIVLARKPLIGTVAENVLAHGTGAINIDACRIPVANGEAFAEREGEASQERRYTDLGGTNFAAKPGRRIKESLNGGGTGESPGRWPANVIHDGSPEVLAAFATAGSTGAAAPVRGTEPSALTQDIYGARERVPGAFHGDTGSPARFFMSCGWSEGDEWTNDSASSAGGPSVLSSAAVVSALVRAVARSMPGAQVLRESCQGPSTSVTASESKLLCALATAAILSIASAFSLGLPPQSMSASVGHARYAVSLGPTGTTTITASHWRSDGSADPVTFGITLPSAEAGGQAFARFMYTSKADAEDRLGSKHPTVKPVDLMAYLVRLVTPPGGLVLDPFAGTGNTGMACMREGFDAILIEREAEYVQDIEKRLAHVSGADTPLFAELDKLTPEQLAADGHGSYYAAVDALRSELEQARVTRPDLTGEEFMAEREQLGVTDLNRSEEGSA